MSQDVNHVILIGRMTREIEVKSTNNGGLIGKFSLASNRSEKRGDSYTDVAGFFECCIFGKQAETLQKHTAKGSRLCVDGSLRWSSWEGADGKRNSKIEIAVNSFQFLDSKKGGEQDGLPQGVDDESIPF